MSLKSLKIFDPDGPSPTKLFGPSLEHMTFVCDRFQARSLGNINTSCPRRKRLLIGRQALDYEWDFPEWVKKDEVDGPLELVDERVKELEL